MISNNGGSWSAIDESMNNVVNAFTFERGQIIVCELDIEKKTLVFTNRATKATHTLKVATGN